jgi:hypothetical protein
MIIEDIREQEREQPKNYYHYNFSLFFSDFRENIPNYSPLGANLPSKDEEDNEQHILGRILQQKESKICNAHYEVNARNKGQGQNDGKIAFLNVEAIHSDDSCEDARADF